MRKPNRHELDTVYLYQTTSVCGLILPPSFHHENNGTTSTTSSTTTTNNNNDDHSEHTTTATAASTLFLDPIVKETFESPEIARAYPENNTNSSIIVAHCGTCGACSNPHDIRIYDQTKETLFQSSYRCSKRAVVGGRHVTRRCLKDAIGFFLMNAVIVGSITLCVI